MRFPPRLITRFLFTAILCAPAFVPAFASAQGTEQEKIPVPLPRAAEPNWNICNQTSYVLRVANAFMQEGRVQASGWQLVNPGACLGETTPQNSPRFLYAQSAAVHQGEIREWAGASQLCAAEDDFRIDAASDCKAENLDTRKYLAVDPNEAQTDLIEPEEFGDKAETAGLQRLLKDAGYKISRIDGVSGRRTSRTISTFKKDVDLPKSASSADLFTALIKAAQDNNTEIGLELCNDSSTRIWNAIATRHQGGWQSRGWWDIEPGACAKPYNAPLDGTEAHIFALQEQSDAAGLPLPDKHLRTVSTVPSQFCIAESKFSALGREFCTENGYSIANFRPVTTENGGTKISFTDEDFADNSTGLRR